LKYSLTNVFKAFIDRTLITLLEDGRQYKKGYFFSLYHKNNTFYDALKYIKQFPKEKYIL